MYKAKLRKPLQIANLTSSAQVNELSGGGMSTQEKVHGLGLKVPDLTPYATGSCIPFEGDGTPPVMKVEGMVEGLLHRPQVLLQLALQCKMMSCRHRDRALQQTTTLGSLQSEYLTGKLPLSLCTCCRRPHNQERCRHK